MRALTFLARRFAWQPHVRTLPTEPDGSLAPDARGGELEDALIAFLHVEPRDTAAETRDRAFRRALKHLKWLANKRDLRRIVLHSFAHLGADNAPPDEARALFDALDARLTNTGYEVHQTPFGWFCAWQIDVHGESLAKVYKDL